MAETLTPSDQQPDAAARLSALKTHLDARGYRTRSTDRILSVVGLAKDSESREVVEIVCEPRAGDGDRLWYRTDDGQWLAEADRLIDAGIAVSSRLRPLHPSGLHNGAGSGINV